MPLIGERDKEALNALLLVLHFQQRKLQVWRRCMQHKP